MRKISLFCVHENQCDRKKCTAVRLFQLGLIELRNKISNCPKNALILDPFAEKELNRDDRGLIEKFGLIVIDCSWEHAESVFRNPFKTGRRLPPLLAANTVNYGRWNRLSTAEALAASLIIVGFTEEAKEILSGFSWGESFFNINKENFEKL